jgi:hypothetical protein
LFRAARQLANVAEARQPREIDKRQKFSDQEKLPFSKMPYLEMNIVRQLIEGIGTHQVYTRLQHCTDPTDIIHEMLQEVILAPVRNA